MNGVIIPGGWFHYNPTDTDDNAPNDRNDATSTVQTRRQATTIVLEIINLLIVIFTIRMKMIE
jgi:hypothetical protein